MLPEPRPRTAPPSFHVLAKPTGAVCNLDCTYCFFLSKEALYPGSEFRMSDETHEQYVRQLLEAHQTEMVSIAWQGGEPTLMGLDFFARTLELVDRYRRPYQVIEHTLQTNGTRIDVEWAAFFAEHRFLVGLSMDGPPDIHDAQRVDKGGKGTHAQVMRAAKLLQAAGVGAEGARLLDHRETAAQLVDQRRQARRRPSSGDVEGLAGDGRQDGAGATAPEQQGDEPGKTF